MVLEVDQLPNEIDQRAKAELLVLGQMRDALIAINAVVQDVRDRVIRIEAKDVESKLVELKAELKEREAERAAEAMDIQNRIRLIELQNAQWKGVFLPVTIVATGVIAAVVAFVMQRVLA